MLFQFLIITTYILTNTYALNTLVALPLSVTSRYEAKNFYRNESVPFSFLNFTGISDTENLKPDEKELLASQNASFISYSPEFTLLIGFNPQLTLIKQ